MTTNSEKSEHTDDDAPEVVETTEVTTGTSSNEDIPDGSGTNTGDDAKDDGEDTASGGGA